MCTYVGSWKRQIGVLAVGGHGKWTVLVAKLKNAKQSCQGCITDILVTMQVILTILAWV